MEQQIYPKYLYKFRYFDEKQHHISTLTHNQLFFSSPGKFNDPFDSKIPVRYEDYTHDEFFEYWDSYFKKARPDLSRKGRKILLKDLYKQNAFNNPRAIEMSRHVAGEIVSTEIGVYSLAGDYKNLLLWSHYSNSHSGFAIGFDEKGVQRYVMETGETITIEKVNYDREYPIINAYRLSKDERFKMQLLTKSIDWFYENEYRIIWFGGANKTLRIPDGIIRRVIMGCQITDINKENLTKILRARNNRPSLFQAIKKESSFALDFKCVKY